VIINTELYNIFVLRVIYNMCILRSSFSCHTYHISSNWQYGTWPEYRIPHVPIIDYFLI